MRMLGKAVLALGVAALLAGPAQAQGFRGGFGMGGNLGFLATNKGVQKELKVSDDQAQKIQQWSEEFRDKMREKMEAIPQDERREKMPALMREMGEQSRKDLKGILKDDQMTRLEQIALQQRGPEAAVNDPKVAEKLKITDDQKNKIQSIQEDARGQMPSRDDFQNDRDAAMKKMADVRKQSREKVMNLLSSEQKDTWKEMTGAPFEVRFERPGGQ